MENEKRGLASQLDDIRTIVSAVIAIITANVPQLAKLGCTLTEDDHVNKGLAISRLCERIEDMESRVTRASKACARMTGQPESEYADRLLEGFMIAPIISRHYHTARPTEKHVAHT